MIDKRGKNCVVHILFRFVSFTFNYLKLELCASQNVPALHFTKRTSSPQDLYTMTLLTYLYPIETEKRFGTPPNSLKPNTK